MRRVTILGLSLLSIFVWASCTPDKPKYVKVPKSEIPHYKYQKLGDNWYKLPTGTLFPKQSIPGLSQRDPTRPREVGLREEVTQHRFEELRFQGAILSPIEHYYPDVYAKLKAKPFAINVLTLHLKVSQGATKRLCEGTNWVPYDEGVEILAGGGCVRSIRPVYFDQHIYLRGTYTPSEAYTPSSYGANWKPTGRVSPRWAETFSPGGDSLYPYIYAEYSIPYLGQDRTAHLLKSAEHFETIVKSIYVGPRLPNEILND